MLLPFMDVIEATMYRRRPVTPNISSFCCIHPLPQLATMLNPTRSYESCYAHLHRDDSASQLYPYPEPSIQAWIPPVHGARHNGVSQNRYTSEELNLYEVRVFLAY
jgi:hypothetical protein